MMNHPLKKLLAIGVSVEIIIFIVSYMNHPAIEDMFRYAARYSGRLSFLIFIYTFYLFTRNHPNPIRDNNQLRNYIQLFAVLHVIHFGFLAMCVYLNSIPLETVKVIGGALAYLMILIAPFKLHAVKFNYQLIYFYYVSLVMALTFVARFKGDFEGAAPHWLHYLGLTTMILCSILFGGMIYKSGKLKTS